MTPKELFLQRLKEQIKVLQDAYDYNKLLPDSFFESLMPPAPEVAKSSLFTFHEREVEEDADYGKNKRLVVQIITQKNKAILKTEIEKEFKSLINSTEDESKTVTNALSALVTDGVVRGWKPDDFKVRGNFWTLTKWWLAGNLKTTYRPIAADYINNKYAENE